VEKCFFSAGRAEQLNAHMEWDAFIIKEDSAKKGVCKRMLNIVSGVELNQLQKEPARQNEVLDLLIGMYWMWFFTIRPETDSTG